MGRASIKGGTREVHLGEAEVGEAHVADLVEEEVLGLEVPCGERG